MNLSDIINPSHSKPYQDPPLRSTQRYSDPCPRRTYDQRHEDMATGLTATHYRSRSPPFPRPYAPPSPPLDELNPLRTLPSIQSLIDMDNSRRRSPVRGIELHKGEILPRPVGSPTRGGRLPENGQPIVSHPSSEVSPTPNDPHLTLCNHIQSPATTSSQSSTAQVQARRPSSNVPPNASPPSHHRLSPPSTSHRSVASINSPYSQTSSPTFSQAPPTSTTYPFTPIASTAGCRGLYEQRPLPTTFPPPTPSIVNPMAPASGETSPMDSQDVQFEPHPHEHHHHYIASGSSSTYSGQSSDRYVCTRCNKAFSRPSSLKIHVHSHTGEKPFICPHRGCGKAFSVRSNMKRHERGCHGPAIPQHG